MRVTSNRRTVNRPPVIRQTTASRARVTCRERVVKDGNVLTSRGPGTALEFALAVVADLEGKAAADKLRSGMLVAP